MTEEDSDEPFLVAPTDEGLVAIKSIESWPSLSFGITSDQLLMSQDNLVGTYRKLSVEVQTEIAQNPNLLTQTFNRFAICGDPVSAVEELFKQIPFMLLRKDRYNCIPVEVAFDSRNGPAARFMLEVAKRAGLLEKLLSYRDQNLQTMLMLAVNLNSAEYADIIDMIVSNDPSGIHRCYDNAGMNVFHVCAKSGLHVSFETVLHSLLRLHKGPSQLNLNPIKSAIEMTDSKQCTPIHYICECENVSMLDTLKKFDIEGSLHLNFDSHFVGNDSLTPLMKSVLMGHISNCQFLLEKGSVNVHCKQHGTCLTALHFAVKTGNVAAIRLLLKHGADAEFSDSVCEDLQGYRTPIDLAREEAIPNKQACIAVLKESIIVDSQVHIVSSLCLRDRTNKPSFL